jgi:EAP30/Vps36 family
VFRAVGKLSVLGTGCAILNKDYISTVPFELSSDQILLIKMAEKTGYVSLSISASSGWTSERFQLTVVICQLMSE